MKYILLTLILALFGSCVQDIDVSQVDDITITPSFEVNLLNYQVENVDFRFPSGFVFELSDTLDFDVLNLVAVRETLKSAEFTQEFNNNFQTRFIHKMKFLDALGNQNHEIISVIPMDTIVVTREELLEADIQAITQTSRIVSEVLIDSNSVSLTGSLKIRSKGLFHFNIEVD